MFKRTIAFFKHFSIFIFLGCFGLHSAFASNYGDWVNENKPILFESWSTVAGDYPYSGSSHLSAGYLQDQGHIPSDWRDYSGGSVVDISCVSTPQSTKALIIKGSTHDDEVLLSRFGGEGQPIVVMVTTRDGTGLVLDTQSMVMQNECGESSLTGTWFDGFYIFLGDGNDRFASGIDFFESRSKQALSGAGSMCDQRHPSDPDFLSDGHVYWGAMNCNPFFPVAVLGGTGSDHIIGGGIVFGQDGDDQIEASWGATVYGGAGNDLIYGSSGQTWDLTAIITLDEHDYANFEKARNFLHGGSGNDIIVSREFPTPYEPEIYSLRANVVHAGDGLDIIVESNLENEIDSSSGADTIVAMTDDLDGDGIINQYDNCVVVSNADQANTFGLDYGDACEDPNTFNSDYDSDDVHNDQDNCPMIFNPDQTDTGGTAMGDACENDATDSDNDGMSDSYELVVSLSNYLVADTCFGELGTIFGTSGDDTINGTNGDDVILGFGGNDVLKGSKGKDKICGGEGNDTLRGQSGKDKLYGGPGTDTLNGGDNDDLLDGGPGDDIFIAPSGSNEGNDEIYAQDSGDDISSVASRHTIYEYASVDPNSDIDNDGVGDIVDNCLRDFNPSQSNNYGTALGDACEDTDNDLVLDSVDNCPELINDQADNYGTWLGDMCEDTDDDSLLDSVDNCPEIANTDQANNYGTSLGDVCEDSDGDGVVDSVEDSYGSDATNTDTDGDLLDDYEEIYIYESRPHIADICNGHYAGASGVILGTPGNDLFNLNTVKLNGEDVTNDHPEKLMTNGENVVFTFGGDDTVFSYGGSDSICTGDGVDTIYAGDGADYVNGGADGDTIDGGPDGDTLYGNEGVDTIYGGDGQDTLWGGTETDYLHGEAGQDTIYGSYGNDYLYGGDANDDLYGQWGNDTLYGNSSNDDLDGGSGTDTCDGGGGNDDKVNCEN